MKIVKHILLTLILTGGLSVFAAPQLGLVKAGTTSVASDSIPLGTATFSLDLQVNTDGNAISGLQYYFTTGPANALTFGATPLTALGNPFVTGDIFGSPAAGATVNQATGTTYWFKGAGADYAAFNSVGLGPNVATYLFNTSSLGAGLYVFTPIGEELSNASDTITTFASPNTFSLTVIAVPEPGSSLLVGAGALVLAMRRRRNA